MTYTTRYSRCFAAEIDGLEKHYARAEVSMLRENDRIAVATDNVSRLRLDSLPAASRIEVDGQEIATGARSPLLLQRVDGSWTSAPSAADWRGPAPVKRPGLQGPIDDAFLSAFVAVAPSGESPNPGVAAAAGERLAAFQREFPKWLRGDVPAVADMDVTEADIREKHLVLFGDPHSNRILAKIAGELPIRWDSAAVRIGARSFDAARHILVMIAPNPLNPDRYVVLNTGHTFGEAEFRGTNALLFPRLGDYAALPSTAAWQPPVSSTKAGASRQIPVRNRNPTVRLPARREPAYGGQRIDIAAAAAQGKRHSVANHVANRRISSGCVSAETQIRAAVVPRDVHETVAAQNDCVR